MQQHMNEWHHEQEQDQSTSHMASQTKEGSKGALANIKREKRHAGVISTAPSRVSLAWGPLELSEPWSMTKLHQISDGDFPVLSLLHAFGS